MKMKNKKFTMVWTFLTIVFLNSSLLPIIQAEEVIPGVTEVTEVIPEVIEQKIVIHNVTFIDPKKPNESTIASLVITDKLFDSVTQDDVAVNLSDIIFDAQSGFILGSLKSGEIANFMILDEDPHKNIEALLDTKSHVLLAIRDGIIIRNNLKTESNISSTAPPKKKKTKRAGWIGYTPPQILLQSVYTSDSWNVYSNDYFSSLFVGAIALDRQKWFYQDAESELQVGDNSLFDGGEIRALRFGVGGALKFDSPWMYTIAGATNSFDKGFDTNTSDNVTFFDWRLDIPTAFNTTLSIGKQKEPISMERLMGMVFLPNQERSVVSDALLPSRNVGVVLSGRNKANTVTWAGGIFNDWLDDDGSIDENSTQFVARSTWLPYESEDESELIHLGFGYRYSNGKEEMRFASSPEFNLSPNYIDTGAIDAEKMSTYNYEASWRSGPYWISSEYINTNIDAPSLNTPSLSGYHVSAAWAITGEMRAYNKRSGTFSPLPVARSVEQSGLGAWELTSRWSVFDGNNGGISAGKTKIFSVGVFWWLTAKLNLSFNYRHIDLDRCSFISNNCDLQGTSSGMNTRILLLL